MKYSFVNKVYFRVKSNIRAQTLKLVNIISLFVVKSSETK